MKKKQKNLVDEISRYLVFIILTGVLVGNMVIMCELYKLIDNNLYQLLFLVSVYTVIIQSMFISNYVDQVF